MGVAPSAVALLDRVSDALSLAPATILDIGAGTGVLPLAALRRGRFPADLAQIAPLVERRRITALVVGLPLDAAQQLTEQAEHCRRYGERLARSLGLPLALVNEHSSSWAAAEAHGLQGDRSGALDSAAAAGRTMR